MEEEDNPLVRAMAVAVEEVEAGGGGAGGAGAGTVSVELESTSPTSGTISTPKTLGTELELESESESESDSSGDEEVREVFLSKRELKADEEEGERSSNRAVTLVNAVALAKRRAIEARRREVAGKKLADETDLRKKSRKKNQVLFKDDDFFGISYQPQGKVDDVADEDEELGDSGEDNQDGGDEETEGRQKSIDIGCSSSASSAKSTIMSTEEDEFDFDDCDPVVNEVHPSSSPLPPSTTASVENENSKTRSHLPKLGIEHRHNQANEEQRIVAEMKAEKEALELNLKRKREKQEEAKEKAKLEAEKVVSTAAATNDGGKARAVPGLAFLTLDEMMEMEGKKQKRPNLTGKSDRTDALSSLSLSSSAPSSVSVHEKASRAAATMMYQYSAKAQREAEEERQREKHWWPR